MNTTVGRSRAQPERCGAGASFQGLKRVRRSFPEQLDSSVIVGRRAARAGYGGPVRVGKELIDKGDALWHGLHGCGLRCDVCSP
jgi:hypothetical protein